MATTVTAASTPFLSSAPLPWTRGAPATPPATSSAATTSSSAPTLPVSHPLDKLASLQIGQLLGPSVQRVADALLLLGGGTGAGDGSSSDVIATTSRGVSLSQLVNYLESHQTPVSSSTSGSKRPWGGSTSAASQQQEHAVAEAVRHGLVVLLQHGLVTARCVKWKKHSNKSSADSYRYQYHPRRALRLNLARYSKYLEYLKRATAGDVVCETLLETVLVQGRLTTIQVVMQTALLLAATEEDPAAATDQAGSAASVDRYKPILDALVRLVQGGFLQQVGAFDSRRQPVINLDNDDEDHQLPEAEDGPPEEPVLSQAVSNGDATLHDDENGRPGKRARLEEHVPEEVPSSTFAAAATVGAGAHEENVTATAMVEDDEEDVALVQLLTSQARYKTILPQDALWTVNHDMFHETLRAFAVGRTVAELYGAQVQSAGSFVTAALRYRAHARHAPTASQQATFDAHSFCFSPKDMQTHLPKPVVQNLAKKPGGLAVNLTKAWHALSERTQPVKVVRRVAEDQYEITLSDLLSFLRNRLAHQIVLDRHGQVSARIVSILQTHGYLESDSLADKAMVPVKETRALLYRLYRSNYVDILQLASARQGSSSSSSVSPANTIYLWRVDNARWRRQILENVSLALYNLRLRREHEEQVGRHWMESATTATATAGSQNEHGGNEQERSDQRKRTMFRLGLERLDAAIQQLDETLMVLVEF